MDFDQRRWAYDIERYERLRTILSRMNYPDSSAGVYVKERLAEIQARYPRHIKPYSEEFGGRAAIQEASQ